MFTKQEDYELNRYIRERIHQSRLEANETQDDLAERPKKSRIPISDIDRGRVAVSTSDLALTANHY
jgi:transcriptional regulator with XRE-family HTH domain